MIVKDGYIVAVARADEQYEAVMDALGKIPEAENGFQYKLRADTLKWELAELPPAEPEPLTDEEALTRYANTLTGANDKNLISAAETLIEQKIKEE